MAKKWVEKASEAAKASRASLKQGTDKFNDHLNESATMTQREIDGSIQALNIFFGAVIGISLAGIEDIPTVDYLLILVMTACAVMMILLVSNTHRKAWNAISMVGFLGLLWWIVEDPRENLDFVEAVPEKLLPTLSVWAAMALLTEFTPRAKEPMEETSD